MPVSITRYNVLLSSPGDVTCFWNAVKREIESVNHAQSEETGIEFHVKDWTRDSRADSGAEPQALLNRQFVEDCDIVLAVFKERFGTPTEKYGSGTEEEIELGLANGKRVMVYFWEPPTDFSPEDPVQYDHVLAFRRKLEEGKSCLYVTFGSEEALAAKVRHDFGKLMFELEGAGERMKPSLCLSGVNRERSLIEGNLLKSDSACSERISPELASNLVREAYEKAAHFHLPDLQKELPTVTSAAGLPLPNVQNMVSALSAIDLGMYQNKSVSISADNQSLILKQLESMGIEPPLDLFYLGGLKSMPSMISASQLYGGGPDLVGSEDEKGKYKALRALVRACRCASEYSVFYGQLESLGSVSLTIVNSGGMPARHVNVEVVIPEGAYISYRDLPIPGDAFISECLEDSDLMQYLISLLFVPQESASYRPYEDSTVKSESGVRLSWTPSRSIMGVPPQLHRHLDSVDFEECLESTFSDYSIVPDPENHSLVLRLSFDRVQQSEAYAFPTVLPIKLGLETTILYRIKADELPTPIEGKLCLTGSIG